MSETESKPNKWPPRPKYRMGDRIVTLDEVFACLSTRQWIYLHGVPKHPSIIANMSLITVRSFITGGCLHRAEPNTQPREKQAS